MVGLNRTGGYYGRGVEKQRYSGRKVGKVSESHATEKTDQGSVLRWRSAPSFPATDYKQKQMKQWWRGQTAVKTQRDYTNKWKEEKGQ